MLRTSTHTREHTGLALRHTEAKLPPLMLTSHVTATAQVLAALPLTGLLARMLGKQQMVTDGDPGSWH